MGRWQQYSGPETCRNGSPYCGGFAAMRAGQLPCKECFEEATAALFAAFLARRFEGETDG